MRSVGRDRRLQLALPRQELALEAKGEGVLGAGPGALLQERDGGVEIALGDVGLDQPRHRLLGAGLHLQRSAEPVAAGAVALAGEVERAGEHGAAELPLGDLQQTPDVGLGGAPVLLAEPDLGAGEAGAVRARAALDQPVPDVEGGVEVAAPGQQRRQQLGGAGVVRVDLVDLAQRADGELGLAAAQMGLGQKLEPRRPARIALQRGARLAQRRVGLAVGEVDQPAHEIGAAMGGVVGQHRVGQLARALDVVGAEPEPRQRRPGVVRRRPLADLDDRAQRRLGVVDPPAPGREIGQQKAVPHRLGVLRDQPLELGLGGLRALLAVDQRHQRTAQIVVALDLGEGVAQHRFGAGEVVFAREEIGQRQAMARVLRLQRHQLLMDPPRALDLAGPLVQRDPQAAQGQAVVEARQRAIEPRRGLLPVAAGDQRADDDGDGVLVRRVLGDDGLGGGERLLDLAAPQHHRRLERAPAQILGVMLQDRRGGVGGDLDRRRRAAPARRAPCWPRRSPAARRRRRGRPPSPAASARRAGAAGRPRRAPRRSWARSAARCAARPSPWRRRRPRRAPWRFRNAARRAPPASCTPPAR